MSVRYFPADNKKYCYTFNVTSRTRYLVRATFLYGNFDNNNVYPKFDISLGPTHWATIVVSDANTIEVQELIFLALDPSISVCLSNATTGQPFISTLELRQFNGSIYLTEFENQFFLSVSARINFGAESEAPVRYSHNRIALHVIFFNLVSSKCSFRQIIYRKKLLTYCPLCLHKCCNYFISQSLTTICKKIMK